MQGWFPCHRCPKCPHCVWMFRHHWSECLPQCLENNEKLYFPTHYNEFIRNTTLLDILLYSKMKTSSLALDSKLSFRHHLDGKIKKANKGIGLIHRLRKYVPRKSLLTIYKSYIRPHLDYGDIIYDHPGNATFVQRLESIQYNTCLAITGCVRGTSREKLYSELGLADRRFGRRMIFFYKIINNLAPSYLRRLLPARPASPVNFRSRNILSTHLIFELSVSVTHFFHIAYHSGIPWMLV